ncbi:NADH dehydrogenase subunit NuoL2 [Streptomyces ambofaciens ATCC 23877]|uniref:NADH dehydrogenase subunit NuoL2 n=1 Tax=Streptomyces ambofaciens (strain ATCC 23877 / 3486 / DSM 40053 / JCM 4204 / NBRC 12836 / NRRL B-2516) TaxID=278992 RepID=A0A0K2AX58_STRA7|nr:NADH-quinone oxidoreductase subunit L [Streptomyces ambofaciens]AKZ57486.1 NADH dehydrogenase subunit NuoL2 [Streptomyces ambofaciens ATCC 23877]
MTTTTLAVLVPLLPFLGAAAGLLLGRAAPGFVRPLAVLPTSVALLLAVLVAARQGGDQPVDAVTELTPTGSVPIELALHIDGFAALVAVLVGCVATCVQIYSTGYLRDDPRYSSYAALVSLFTSAMFLVVYSGDLMVLLVGWEIMGICSYFLVGHYWETPEARAASLKAFLVTKLGDVPFLIGLLALATEAGSFRITKILGAVASGSLDHPTLIALLLLAGVAGKSAQFPLHTWLPDAMAGPTPVSALIHAATMVAAGVYFVARLLPLFEASRAAMIVLAVMAAVTMVGSALAALAQDDIKRVLAYSTIGQLGYMTGALAAGDRGAAVFHLISHGAFKALLFLAAGVIIHAAGTNSLAAMSRMRGLRDRVPDAYWTMTVALLALAAIPPFSGFFSKESVLVAAEHVATGHTEHAPGAAGWTVLVAGLVTALLTAAYAARLWLLAFRGRGAEAPDHGRQPLVMNAVLWVLAIPSLALGGLAFRLLPDWFDGQDLTPTLTTSVLGTGVALIGGIVTYAAWRHTTAFPDRPPLGAVAAHPEGDAALVEAEAIASHEPAYGDIAYAPDPSDPGRLLLGPLHRHAAVGFHLDAVYTALFVRPVQAGASLVRFLDREVVDTYVRGAGALPRWLGTAVRRAQTGNVQTYVSALLAGTVVLAVAAVLVATGA